MINEIMMRFQSKFSLPIFLVISWVIYGCDALEEALPIRQDNGSISAMLNGVQFEAEGGGGLLSDEFLRAELEKGDGDFLLTVYGINIEEDNSALAVGFQIAGNQLDEIQAGNTYEEWVLIDEKASLFEGAKGAVEKRNSIGSDDHLFKASTYYTGEMSLTISEIDTLSQQFSGTFSFSALDEENDTLLNVTQGSFENVKWKTL